MMETRAQPGPRTLRFEIFRFDPTTPDIAPHVDTFVIEESPYMTLFLALTRIREEQDPSLQFDFACRSAICGSCGMLPTAARCSGARR
jgi:fumarate reductase iron-sulfur subunit